MNELSKLPSEMPIVESRDHEDGCRFHSYMLIIP